MNRIERAFAALRTLVYMTGFVVVWGWLALVLRHYDPAIGFTVPGWAAGVGFVLIAAGGAVALVCGCYFALRGVGTPAPFDPPREFVAVGPYRYVRNPMYVGGVLLLAGFGLALRSPAIVLLAVAAIILVHLFVVLVEEPGLRHRFGESYRRYTASVNRWLPHPPRNRVTSTDDAPHGT
jgi:protein-S-isoprenylcysteine O-methyltransferase Ste14